MAVCALSTCRPCRRPSDCEPAVSRSRCLWATSTISRDALFFFSGRRGQTISGRGSIRERRSGHTRRRLCVEANWSGRRKKASQLRAWAGSWSETDTDTEATAAHCAGGKQDTERRLRRLRSTGAGVAVQQCIFAVRTCTQSHAEWPALPGPGERCRGCRRPPGLAWKLQFFFFGFLVAVPAPASRLQLGAVSVLSVPPEARKLLGGLSENPRSCGGMRIAFRLAWLWDVSVEQIVRREKSGAGCLRPPSKPGQKHQRASRRQQHAGARWRQRTPAAYVFSAACM